jgi:carbon-monoxide dehydrogenase medium subunit
MPQTSLVGLRSRKHIPPFDLLRAQSVEEASSAMLPNGNSALMAGGLDLIDRMKRGEAFERLIFLGDIASMHGIRRDNGQIVIGALTTHAEVAGNDALAAVAPDLPVLWQTIANPRVRKTGTIGGNLMSGLPHYDTAPALLALGAKATIRTAAGTLTAGIDELAGHRDALLEAISIAEAPSLRLLVDRSLHPTLSIYLAARFDKDELHAVRITIGCAFAQPVAVDLAVGGEPLAALANRAADIAGSVTESLPTAIVGDGVASAAYRRRMCGVLIRRLLVRLGATV